MRPATRRFAVALGLFIAALALAPAASACPTCYGQASGPMIDGMNSAILAMIGVTGFVLSGFAALFVSIGRRIRRHTPGAAPATGPNTLHDRDS